jgi:hypothetical protein
MLSIVPVPCACGLTVRVERDECGTSVELHPCSDAACRGRFCEHDLVACRECGEATCPEHRVDYSHGSICRACAAAEVADGAEALVEAL